MLRKILLFLCVLSFSALFHLYGIRWGVPGQERINLVFGDKTAVESLRQPMLETHEEIREMQVFYGAQYRPDYSLDEKLQVRLGRRTFLTTRELLNSSRSYLTRSYGADEQAVLVGLSKMKPKKFDFNPHFFEYGGVYLYPVGAFLKFLAKVNLVKLKSDLSFYLLAPEELGKLYMAGRLLGAIGGLMAVLVFCLACHELFRERILSFWLALCFGSCPGLVMWSHYLKPFSYGILWVVLTIWLAIKFFQNRQEKWLYLASLCAGLSFGTLLSYGYVFWAVVLTIVLTPNRLFRKFKQLLFSSVILLGGFFLTNPYVLLTWQEFWQELGYLREYWRVDISLGSLKFFFFNSLRYGMGTGLWCLTFLSIAGLFLARPGKQEWLLVLSFLPGFFYFAFTTGRWVHYSLLLYPFFLLSAGFFLDKIGLRKLVFIVLPVVSLYTFFHTASYVRLFGQENVRTTAGNWINQSIKPGEKIGLLEAPSPWRTPPFRFLDYELIVTSDKGVLTQKKPTYFCVSEYQWARGGSLKGLEALLSDYEVVRKFERIPSFLGMKFKHPEIVPYDWYHPNPTIMIWKRKK